MTIKTEKPLDYTGQVWRGIDDKFPKKIHNATTTSDGLMSAEDKAKLDSIGASGGSQIYDVVTWESNGLMIGEDKKKLDGIEENANNYIHPNTPEIRHVTDEQITYWNTKASTNIATPTLNGLMSAEDKAKLDLVDETVCNITYEKATTTSDGLMSKEDKVKVDNMHKTATPTSDGLMSKEDKVKVDNMHKSATQFSDGLMSYYDKIKLDSIEENANYYVHPNTEGMRHVSDAEKDYWNSKADKNIVTNAENGLMSYLDKIKLDSIDENASNYIHPDDENTRHVTDAQIKKWSSIATITTDGLMSKEDKQLLMSIAEDYNVGNSDVIRDILRRVKTIEEKLQTAVFYDTN